MENINKEIYNTFLCYDKSKTKFKKNIDMATNNYYYKI